MRVGRVLPVVLLGVAASLAWGEGSAEEAPPAGAHPPGTDPAPAGRPKAPGAAPKAARKPPRRKTRASRARVRPTADEPPECGRQARPTRPPARSMPELFERMAEGLARDPGTAFQGMVEELSELESPALEGISVDPQEERRAGQKARSEYLDRAEARGFRVVDDPRRQKYLEALVDRLASRMKNRDRYPRIDVTLIDAPVSDGQSFPGGSLVFTTALLEEPDEATVVGVIAHELAHLDRGHLYSYVRRSKLVEATYGPFAGGGGVNFDEFFTKQAALLGLILRPFRPEHESEADCTAATWMYQEGYDPRALVGFFERLNRRRRDEPANPFFDFLRTHPFSLDRRDAVLNRLAVLRRWRPAQELGLFAENLRRRVPRGPMAGPGEE